MTHIVLSAQVPETFANQRLDLVAAQLFPDYSRARLQTWIKEGQLKVNSSAARPRDTVYLGDELSVDVVLQAEREWEAQAMPIDIVFEDVVRNKLAGRFTAFTSSASAKTLKLVAAIKDVLPPSLVFKIPLNGGSES